MNEPRKMFIGARLYFELPVRGVVPELGYDGLTVLIDREEIAALEQQPGGCCVVLRSGRAFGVKCSYGKLLNMLKPQLEDGAYWTAPE